MKRIVAMVFLALCCIGANAVPTVNILFAFTPLGAAYQSGSTLSNRVNNEILQFNSAFSQSHLASYAAVASVGFVVLSNEYGTNQVGVQASESNAPLAVVRDLYGADVVVVITGPVGAGWVFCGWSGGIQPQPDAAYSIVAADCALSSATVRHEVGHLLGLRHDYSGGTVPDTSMTPYPLGHGYIADGFNPFNSTYVTCFRDLMSSYVAGCVHSPGRMPALPNYYSSLDVLFNDVNGKCLCFVGGDPNSPNYSNSASALKVSVPQVATYRGTKIAPRLMAKLIVPILTLILSGV